MGVRNGPEVLGFAVASIVGHNADAHSLQR
jgi:hypothetical protein